MLNQARNPQNYQARTIRLHCLFCHLKYLLNDRLQHHRFYLPQDHQIDHHRCHLCTQQRIQVMNQVCNLQYFHHFNYHHILHSKHQGHQNILQPLHQLLLVSIYVHNMKVNAAIRYS